MAFVPALDMLVWLDKRPGTSALVRGVAPTESVMWLEPIDGGRWYSAPISDHWSQVERPVTLVEAWFLAGPVGSGAASWSRAFFTRAGALNAVDSTTVAILHVKPDGTISPTEYII